MRIWIAWFGQRSIAVALLAACAVLSSGCMHGPATTGADASTATFIVVRHAEKAMDDPIDPPLTPVGQARAGRLVTLLQDEPLTAVYATAFRRTQATAAPTAQAWGLEVATYDARQPAREFAAQLRRQHRHGTVLVVGHSNTIPAIASALCACAVDAMPETEYGRYFRLSAPPQADRPARLEERAW